METLFLVSFVAGALFTAVSVLLGLEHSTAAGSHAGHGHFHLSSVVAFLTFFGAAGYVLLTFGAWPLLAALATATVVGALASAAILFLLLRLRRGERVMDPSEYRLVGTVARVTVSIPADGVGEIVFAKAGSRRSEAARSCAGHEISRDTEVVVTDYARGIAIVQPWDELIASRSKQA